MNFNINKVKIIVTVPKEKTEDIRNAICDLGAGVIGNYSHCSISTKCIGTFKPNDNSNPYLSIIFLTNSASTKALNLFCAYP